MKSRILVAGVVGLLSVSAVSAQQVDPAQMQLVLEQAKVMQECIDQMDQGTMASLQRDGEQTAADIESLCAAGKRDEAQAKALAFGKDLASSPELARVQECTAPLKAMALGLATLGPGADGALHVCDMH